MRARVDKSGIACELERARTRTDALLAPLSAEDLVQQVSPIMSPLVWDYYRVLRGGSWATGPLVARTTFRNWDYPQRRQIFAGIRCAHDA